MAQSVPVPHTLTIVVNEDGVRREIKKECVSRGACDRVRREARTFHGENFVCAFIDKVQAK